MAFPDWQQLPLWIAGIVLALILLRRLMLLELLLRQRFEAARSLIRPRERLPASVREVLAVAEPALRELGFEPSYGQVIWNGLLARRQQPQFADVYFHPALRCHASVAPAEEPEAGALVAVEFLTCYADGRQLLTLNRRLHTIASLPPDWLVDDAYAPDLAAQWELHRQRMAAMGDAAVAQDPTEAWRRSLKLAAAYIPYLVQRGVFSATRRPGVWRFSLLGAVRFLRQLMAGAKKATRARPPQPAAAVGEPARVRALADAYAYARSMAARENAPSHWLAKLALFGGSALLGALAFGLAWSWHIVPALLGVLLFHELGHLAAMRLSGYRDLSVFFVPFVGAAASGRKDDATPWQRLFVYLAGPVPGLILGALCLWLAADAPPAARLWLVQVGALALVLNFLNLLPFLPLDGGRVVETLLFARLPRLRLLFFAFSALALLGAALYIGDGVLLAVAVLLLLTLPAEFRLTRLLGWLRRRHAQIDQPKLALRNLFSALAHSGGGARLNFAQRVQTVRSLLPLATQRVPRWMDSLLGMALYGAVLAAPVALVAAVSPLAQIAQLVALAASSPAAPPGGSQDWDARIAQATGDAGRWELLFDAGQHFEDNQDLERARGYYRRALELAGQFGAGDVRRADAHMALARCLAHAPAEAITHYEAAMENLADAQGVDRLRVAQALEAMAHITPGAPAAARIGRLQHALAVRESLPQEQIAQRLATRRELAMLMDESGDAAGAETLLRRNLAPEESAPQPTDAPSARLDLAWFLIAHDRAPEAQADLQQVLDGNGAPPAADALRRALAWAHLEASRYDDAAAGFQDLLERRDTAQHPAPRGAERLELLMDLILTAQRRGDAVVEAGWRKEATDLLLSLPPSEAQALRQRTYPLRADAARDWQRRRWQSYGRIAATL